MRLEAADYEVIALTDEDKALAAFKFKAFDLCVLDLMLAQATV